MIEPVKSASFWPFPQPISCSTLKHFDRELICCSLLFKPHSILLSRLDLIAFQVKEARDKDILWIEFVCSCTEAEECDSVTWGVYNANNSTSPCPDKTTIGIYPLQRQSPNSHSMMRHTIDIAKYVISLFSLNYRYCMSCNWYRIQKLEPRILV